MLFFLLHHTLQDLMSILLISIVFILSNFLMGKKNPFCLCFFWLR